MDSYRLPREPTPNMIEAAIPLLSEHMNPGKARRALLRIYEAFIDHRPDTAYPPGLTKKMAQLMETIAEYQEENGFAPTQEELAAMFGQDRTTIRNRLYALKRKGYIQIRRGHRGIVILRNP